jgi:hypothetical protein
MIVYYFTSEHVQRDVPYGRLVSGSAVALSWCWGGLMLVWSNSPHVSITRQRIRATPGERSAHSLCVPVALC